MLMLHHFYSNIANKYKCFYSFLKPKRLNCRTDLADCLEKIALLQSTNS